MPGVVRQMIRLVAGAVVVLTVAWLVKKGGFSVFQAIWTLLICWGIGRLMDDDA